MDDQDSDVSLTQSELDNYREFFKHEKTMNLSKLQDAITGAVDKGHGPELLLSTSRRGFQLTVQLLLSSGVDVITSRDIFQNSPLHQAAVLDQAQTVRILIEYGASENVKNYHDRLPLHVAAWHGSIQILEHFVHFELADVEDEFGKTPISIALDKGRSLFFTRVCHRIHTLGHCDSALLKSVFLSAMSHKSMFVDICQILIMENRLGLVKFLMDNFGTSLTGSESKILHIAARHGTSEMVKLICDFENNVDLPNDEGNTPLHLAVYNPRLSTEMVICLAAQSQNINNFQECKTVLHSAAQSGKLSMCTALIKWCSKLCDVCDEHGRLPVHTAAMAKSEQVLALLISNTNDINVYDSDGKTPVYYALNNDSFHHMHVVEQFIQKDNMNNNTTLPCDSFTKRRMLHVSAALGLDEACKVITNLGQYMNFDLDFNDKLPIEYAFKNCSMDTVEYMMVAMTTFHQRKSTWPETKALIKDACIHIMHLIIEDDADITEGLLDMLLDVLNCESIISELLYKATSRGRTAIVIKLLAAGANINAIDPSTKATPLHAAIANGYLATLICLVAHNALENVVDSQQNYPLHIAAQCGSLEALQHLQKSLNNPNILNAKNALGDTPLLCAIQDSPAHVECVRELLSHRADINILASDGSLPIELGPTQSMSTATNLFCIISQYSDNIDDIIEGFRQLHLHACISAEDYSSLTETLLQIIERTERKNILCLFDIILDECSLYESWDFQSCFLRALIEKESVDLIQLLLQHAPGEQHTPEEQHASGEQHSPGEQLTPQEQNVSGEQHVSGEHNFLEKQDYSGVLPVHIAAESGSEQIFQLFVASTPADLLETRTSDRLTVYHLAVQNKHISDAVICSLIMKNKVMLQGKDSIWKPNLLFLAVECQRNVVIETLMNEFQRLISTERDAPKGITPLEHYSMCGKSTKLMERMLLRLDSYLSVENKGKSMPYCLRNDSSTCVCFLKKYFENDVECFTYGGMGSDESILHAAVKRGTFELCEYLLSVKPVLANLTDRVGNLPLFYALQNQSNDLVLLLLQHTPDPNGTHAVLALDRAMQNASLPMSTIKLLLSKGLRCYDREFRKAKVRKHHEECDAAWLVERCTGFRSETRNSLLLSDICQQMHHIVLSGDNAAIQKEVGAIKDLNQLDMSHRTPLHLAVTNSSVSLDSIRALVENGAWVDAVGGFVKETPLLMALEAKRLDVCRYLLSQGAEPCIANRVGSSPLHIALCDGDYGLFMDMLHVTRDLNKCDKRGNSLLRVAIQDQNVPYIVVETLVNLGADIGFHTSYIHPRHRSTTQSLSDIRARPGLLHMAILAKKLGECKLLCAKDSKFVRNCVSDPNPIHVLISMNDLSFASSLMQPLLNAKVWLDDIQEEDSYSPLELAAMQGSTELLKLLISYGAEVELEALISCEKLLERNNWTPEVVVALMQGGMNLSFTCGEYDCVYCDNSLDYNSKSAFICAMLYQTKSDILGGYRFVCHVAIHLGLPIRDCRLESEECGTVLGRDVQLALLEMVTNPRPLTLLCRDFIRGHLHQCSAKNVVQRIESIAVPELLKSFLKMEDVDISTIKKSLDVPLPTPSSFLSRYAIPVVESDEEMQDYDEESMSDVSMSSHEESDAESDL